MTDRPPDPGAPRPGDVRRSLRALADGSAPARDPRDGTTDSDIVSVSPESVVNDAERAAQCACEAASFLSAGRLPELDRAVATAGNRGDSDVAARGRSAQESLRRLDAVLDGRGPTEPPSGVSTSRPGDGRRSFPDDSDPDRHCDSGTSPVSDQRTNGDHFHSGRGTVLGDTAQGSGR